MSTRKKYPEYKPDPALPSKVAETAVATYTVSSAAKRKPVIKNHRIAGIEASNDIWEFAQKHQLVPHLETAVRLVKESFYEIRTMYLIFDPDPEESSLDGIIIHITIGGPMEEWKNKLKNILTSHSAHSCATACENITLKSTLEIGHNQFSCTSQRTTVMFQFRKKFSKTTLVIIALAAFGFVGVRQSQSTAAIGKVNFMLGGEGGVTIRRLNDPRWTAARFKMDISKGDQLRTAAESRCEIKLTDGSIIRIGENSLFDFGESNLSKSSRQVDASLKKGKFWANVTKMFALANKFEVKSPTAVCAIRGTIYRMESDSTTRVAVYEGKVDIGPTNDLRQQLQQQFRPGAPQQIPGPTQIPGPFQVSLEQWVQLVQGYQLEVRANGRYAKTKIDSVKEAKSDWVQWNKERDLALPQ